MLKNLLENCYIDVWLFGVLAKWILLDVLSIGFQDKNQNSSIEAINVSMLFLEFSMCSSDMLVLKMGGW